MALPLCIQSFTRQKSKSVTGKFLYFLFFANENWDPPNYTLQLQRFNCTCRFFKKDVPTWTTNTGSLQLTRFSVGSPRFENVEDMFQVSKWLLRSWFLCHKDSDQESKGRGSGTTGRFVVNWVYLELIILCLELFLFLSWQTWMKISWSIWIN